MSPRRALLTASSVCFVFVSGNTGAQQIAQSASAKREAVHLAPGPGWKVTGKHTLGAYSLVEGVAKPGTGPEPHRHSKEDESFYVLEGELEFRVGERTILAGPGSFVFAPRGVPHTFKSVGTTPARFITVISPAGLENFFAERNRLMKEISPKDPAYAARHKELAERYGLEFRSDWSFPPN